jgi:rSAM/selenodomain-associated transferase 1
MPSSSPPTLGLFAKWPSAAQVKTRLAAETSAEWSAQVAHAFLQDTIERVARISVHRVLAYAPVDTAAEFAALVQDRFQLLPQGNGDLGQRMARFFTTCLVAGGERVVLIGTDSPTFPLFQIQCALEALRHADVVLAPATDGGYCLIGCAHQVPPIFDGIAWGTSTVMAETVKRLQQASLTLKLLPTWYDVDTLQDWQMLRGHVAAMRLAGEDPGIPCTESLLNQPFPTATVPPSARRPDR